MDQGLYKKSIQTILANQSQWGSFIASPNFPTYQYCWLRDGSYIAHAMDTAGEFRSASAFFEWVGRTIKRFSYKVDEARLRLDAGLPMGKDDLLHTRFTLDGEEVYIDHTWGNFQIDGYGTWLWALNEHVKKSGEIDLLQRLKEPIEITVRYLELAWRLPNYDCWEEHPEYLHTYSLSTVYAGFQAACEMTRSGKIEFNNISVNALAEEVRKFILDHAVKNGRLVKYFCPPGVESETRLIGNDGVDASLLAVATPYQLFMPDDPIILATIKTIEEDLYRSGGGVYRYKADVYYGGGEWILLTAWLGWYYVSSNQVEKAKIICRWIESQADENDWLAEQVSDYKLYPEHFAPWVKKWGPIAKPLIWSHAMYIILINAIYQGK
ncbi:MAG: glycoside hydrolase [Chloroflexi bacterium HGW-Chloroflexi-5]|jgi:GH15 family glucan-1,4-alpha-glucosidase|nr:MAG: glycoside hydrolase [Chloroflexi bacterium HGW-Chloroflexi-5]